MKFTIDRRYWYRGALNSALLREDGDMCCLGQILLQSGVPREHLLGVFYPAGTREHIPFDSPIYNLLIRPMGGDTQLSTCAAVTNDDRTIEDDEREQDLIDLFAHAGVELEFIN